ncbi:MAG: DNA polymerase IV [Coriobacteriaceae bacterium]|nr:DNA polymerase IV [Coriobacteriaceae bacterium]
MPPWSGPAIILVDLDAFFATVEQLDNPDWRGKPVIVGGDPNRHGVVSTASYEARAFGVRSAMPSYTAARLCPHAIWTPGHHSRYREMSRKVMGVVMDESPFVQQVSIDEAFADVSPSAHNPEHPVTIARRIQDRIESLGVSASIGIGTSKTVAKIASDRDKPRGLTVVYPGRERDFLAPLPVRALSGIGAKAEHELHRHGIETLGDLAASDPSLLKRLFGKNGEVMYVRAKGGDDSPITTDDEVKSVSHEVTFANDLSTEEEVEAALSSLAAKVGRRLRMKGIKGHTLGLKLRYDDRSLRSVQTRLEQNTDDDLAFMPKLLEMLQQVWKPGIPVRLLGVQMSGFDVPDAFQPSLFELPADGSGNVDPDLQPTLAQPSGRARLLEATDKVRDRFGEDAVQFGHEMRTARLTTGSGPKDPADYK